MLHCNYLGIKWSNNSLNIAHEQVILVSRKMNLTRTLNLYVLKINYDSLNFIFNHIFYKWIIFIKIELTVLLNLTRVLTLVSCVNEFRLSFSMYSMDAFHMALMSINKTCLNCLQWISSKTQIYSITELWWQTWEKWFQERE